MFSFGILLVFLFNLSVENYAKIVEAAPNRSALKKPKFADENL